MGTLSTSPQPSLYTDWAILAPQEIQSEKNEFYGILYWKTQT